MEIVMLVVFIILVYVVLKTVADYRYNKLESEVLKNLGFSNWNIIANIDAYVAVKSRQTLEKYDDIKFFKENKEKFAAAEKVIQLKHKKAEILKKFLGENDFKKHLNKYDVIHLDVQWCMMDAGSPENTVPYINKPFNV